MNSDMISEGEHRFITPQRRPTGALATACHILTVSILAMSLLLVISIPAGPKSQKLILLSNIPDNRTISCIFALLQLSSIGCTM